MNKKELLEDYRKQEDKISLSQILDKIEFASNRGWFECSDFLDMYQISLVEAFLRKIKYTNYTMYGGTENSERKLFIACPDGYDLENFKENISQYLEVVRITLPEFDKGKYEHRNYLGGIVKCGLKREKIGDIIVYNEGADIICVKEFSEILKSELVTLTRFEKSTLEVINILSVKKQEIKMEEMKINVASLRLDNIVSDLARTSRSKAVEIISNERVFINGQNETKPSKAVKVGDVLTIRGKGKFIIKELSGTTRSGRTVVLVEKYI